MREHPKTGGITMHLNNSFVRCWSHRYVKTELRSPTARERVLLSMMHPATASHGCMTRDQLDWMRHHVLCILAGVGQPVASAILTIWKPETQTVLDVRAVAALQALGELQPTKTGGLPDYWNYLERFREVASDLHVTHRDLDRALWKWHKAGMPETCPGQYERQLTHGGLDDVEPLACWLVRPTTV